MSDERLETTMDLLAMTLPGVGSPEKGYVDSEEDEIFFGQKSSKEEEKVKSKKINLLRRTLQGVTRSPQSSPKNAFNPIEEEAENDNVSEKENACVAPAPSPTKDVSDSSDDLGRQKTPLKDIQLHQKVAAASSPKPTPSPRKINTANPDCDIEDGGEMLLPPTPKTRQNLTPVKTPVNRVQQLKTEEQGLKREVKSASKLLANLPATVVDAMAAHGDDDDEEENSILDVNNDQLFDDSIFTEYDASNLSSIATTTSKSWQQVARQERRKTGNFVEAPSITSLVEQAASEAAEAAEAETTTCVPETPASLSLDEVEKATREAENRRRDSSASTFSDYFNTTREEKILFEKYGEDYDDIVGQMSRSEKMRLKQEVGDMEAKAAGELLSYFNKSLGEEAKTIATVKSPEQDISNTSETSPEGGRLFAHPLGSESSGALRSATDSSLGEEVKTAATIKSNLELKTPSRGLLFTKSSNPEFRTPTFSRLNHQGAGASGGKTMPNYLRPTQSSRLRASPSKTSESPLPAAGRMFAHPLGSGSSGAFRSAAPDSPAPGRLFAHPSLTPQSSLSKLPVRRVAASGIDMKSIVSPVSQYIKSTPAPSLVSTIRPKACKFLGEDLLQGLSDDEEPQPPQRTEYAQMPDRQYISSRVALEQRVAPDVQHKELPKAFGMGNTTEATVVKHLGRTRVPKTLDMASPSKDGACFKKAPPRESMGSNNTMDESSMELSIREVKEIKKLTTLPRK